jgi:hypothetical protein
VIERVATLHILWYSYTGVIYVQIINCHFRRDSDIAGRSVFRRYRGSYQVYPVYVESLTQIQTRGSFLGPPFYVML